MSDAMVLLEAAEMNACADLYRAASPSVVAAAGLFVRQLDDTAVVLAARHVDVLALNRVIGLGLRGPVTESTLDAVVQALEATGSPRGFVPIAPMPGASAIAAALEARALRHYNNWMRLRRNLDNLDDIGPPSGALDVRRIGAEGAPAFGRLVAEGFGFPASLALFVAAPIGRTGWSHYLAFEGDTPIAAAAMFVAGEAAWFGFMATDAAHRRKGAQHALVVRRLHDAAAAGCQWVSVETAEDNVEKDAPSFRNLRRLGFDVAYRRPNYLWSRH
jgi:GNAT superfamily N-acetyltransferase